MESYHTNLCLHLPLSSLEDVLMRLWNPPDAFSAMDNIQMSNELLPIDGNFEHLPFLAYIFYRLWSAQKSFPRLAADVEAFVKTHLVHFHYAIRFNNPGNVTLNKPIGFSALLHASCCLLENDEVVVQRAIKDCWTAFQLGEVEIETLTEPKKELYLRLSLELQRIIGTPMFKKSLTSYFNFLQVSASEDKISSIIETCKAVKIRAIKTHGAYVSVGGLVTPDGFGLDLESLTEGLNEEQQLARCLYTMCHELAHYILRLEPVSALKFANNTPNKSYIIHGVPCSSLKGGYLFTMLMFGSYQKRFWKNESALKKFLDIQSWPSSFPLFSQKEVLNLENDEILNPYNSGIFSIPTKPRLSLYI